VRGGSEPEQRQPMLRDRTGPCAPATGRGHLTPFVVADQLPPTPGRRPREVRSCMSAESRKRTGALRTPPLAGDQASRRWTEQLRTGHPRRDETVAELHAVLLRSAYHELSRRRAQLGSVSGPEFDDLPQQAADDALVNILAKLGRFAGLSRFTTWAYKFVIFEISRLVSRHAWQRQPPRADELVWERLVDSPTTDPAQHLERSEQLAVLASAVDRLTRAPARGVHGDRAQRRSDRRPGDQAHSTRNAVYKNLFDAGRSLRMSMAANGHPVLMEDRNHD